MSNETLEALPILALLLQFAVLGWRFWGGDARPMMALNVLAAIGAGIPLGVGVVRGPWGWAEGFYAALCVLFAFELFLLATSLGWLARRDPRSGVLAHVGFGVHVLLTVAALVFVLTFRIDRLF